MSRSPLQRHRFRLQHLEQVSQGSTTDDRAAMLPRLSINQILTHRWPLNRAVDECRRLGIPGIGVWRNRLEAHGEQQGIELIERSGLRVSSLSWTGAFTGSHGMTWAEAVDDTRHMLHVARQLNADCLLVASGGRFRHIMSHCRRVLIDALRELADDAEHFGIPLALQPMSIGLRSKWSFLSSIEQTLDILHAVDHRHVKMCFNMHQLQREPDLIEQIPSVCSQVALVQLCDWKSKSPFDGCLPGDGDAAVREVVSAFLDAGYSGSFEVDVWDQRVWDADYQPALAAVKQEFDAIRVPFLYSSRFV